MCLFEVRRFSSDTFLSLIAKYSPNNEQVIKGKRQYKYFCGYLTDIGCTTIVVEPEYIDHDYMVDHSAYYVSCFERYRRHCARLHFFKNNFNDNDIKNLLLRKSGSLTIEALKESYLGFMVVKRLPRTFIGRTCVRTYDENEGRRVFPLRRNYRAHLFGIPLTSVPTLVP